MKATPTKRYCELCDAPARVYCDADQASLCWDCDGAVHGANFLVARHCRTLLCQTCNSTSEWRASGSKLVRMVSVCEDCSPGEENEAKEDDFDEIDVRDNDDFGVVEEDTDDSEMEEVVSDVEDRDNQVVPSVSEMKILLKRKRGDASDLCCQFNLRRNITLKYGGASTTEEDCGSGEEMGEAEGKQYCLRLRRRTVAISSAELGSRGREGRGRESVSTVGSGDETDYVEFIN